ncbi:MAG: acyltransferase family protein [Bacilli bacterium]
MSTKKERNQLIDVIKAIAIILVIVGHSIQYGAGEMFFNTQSYFDNGLFKFIYSFHMPLFMLVSGYLFYFSTIKHSLNHNIKTRIFSLLLPIAIWTLPQFIYYIIQNSLNISIIQIILKFTSFMRNNLWFLWAVLLCSIIVLIVNRLFKDSVIIYIIGIVATLFVPDIIPAVYKFMLPYFILGYLFNKYFTITFKRIFSVKKNQFICLGLSGLIFIILLIFFNRDSYIYTSGFYILKESNYLFQLAIDTYRFIIGLFGSIFIISSVKLVWNKLPKFIISSLSYIGKYSLGIYILSGYIFIYLLPLITAQNIGLDYVNVCLHSVVIMTISLVMSIIITKIPLLNKLLFGGR